MQNYFVSFECFHNALLLYISSCNLPVVPSNNSNKCNWDNSNSNNKNVIRTIEPLMEDRRKPFFQVCGATLEARLPVPANHSSLSS